MSFTTSRYQNLPASDNGPNVLCSAQDTFEDDRFKEVSPMQSKKTFATFGCALVLAAATLTAHAQGTGAPATAAPAAAAPAPAERVAAIKASLAQSAQNLRQYQW